MTTEVVAPSPPDPALEHLLEALYERYHHDFRAYARRTLARRVDQAVSALGASSIGDLEDRVLRDPTAFSHLLSYLTIRVTEMFRDPPFYRALREQVVPHLRTYPWVRVWVAGCSTGEEVWSLAILLHEEGLLERTRIYATDIHPGALVKAEAGVYSRERVASYSAAYLAAGGRGSLSDYYTAAYQSALFDPRLRENVVFSDHSLTTDGVFAEVQLVTCRNVLIYFDAALRDRAVGLFRDSLCHGGVLGLGARESLVLSAHAAAFEPVSRPLRIYRKR